MTSSTEGATVVARRLWTRSTGAGAASDIGPAAERLCIDLRVRLGAWIGTEGYQVLMDRAVERTRAEHPVVDQLACLNMPSGTAAAALASHGPAAVAAAMIALMAQLIEALERIVGAGMATGLIEQAVMPGPRAAVRQLAQRGTHD